MSSPLTVPCPSCAAKLKVPAELAGKTIKCKSCQTAFKVPAAGKPLPAELAKPVQAKPAQAKPAAPPPVDAPMKFADDDDDEAGGNYGVVTDNDHIPRCPRCAKELDPPDTLICMNCGYDLQARKRHGTRKVYALTTWDYIKHLAPGVGAILFGGAVLGGAIFCSLKMRGWLTGSFLDAETKDPTTLKQEFLVQPFCFNIWLLLIATFVLYKMGWFGIKRLFIHWRPEETIKKD